MSDLTRDELRELRNDYSMNEQQIKEYQKLLKDHPTAARSDVLQAYRTSGFDVKSVATRLQANLANNKFLISYDLMPDGSIGNYTETPIE